MDEYYTSAWWRPAEDKLMYWSPGVLTGLGPFDKKPEEHILVYGIGTVVGYNPLVDCPNLYLEFTRLPLGRESFDPIADFANRYGPLGADLKHEVLLPDSNVVRSGELGEAWLWEIDELRVAVDVWQLARRGKTKELRDHIEWTSNAIFYRNIAGNRMICGENDRPEVYKAIKKRKREVVLPAMLYVQDAINRSLFKRSRIFMFSDLGNLKNLTQRSAPKGLIGAMWLQFANAVHAQKTPAECQFCNQIYVPTRSDAQFCSNTCRQKAYNERRWS